MISTFLKNRKLIIGTFVLLAILSVFSLPYLKFTFSFEQFFPEGDDDLEFFNEFIEEFETDDNFMLIAIENEPTVFDSIFLDKFHRFALEVRSLPGVIKSQSLTQMKYPLKTPFGITAVPAIHRNKPHLYDSDKSIILADERMRDVLIDTMASSMVVSIKNVPKIGLEESQELIGSLDSLLAVYEFSDYHMLGRAYFTAKLVEMQIREIAMSSIVSIFLVFIVMMFLYRRAIGVLIGLTSIGVGLLLFLGLLSVLGRELSVMAALYPVLMLIVGTSDVIHIMTKYIDELKSGKSKEDAIGITIKEIGLATLLTSMTTAAGFITLLSSRIIPIREFGVNSAMGVMIAYITVVFLTCSLLSMFSRDQIIKESEKTSFWNDLMTKWYLLTRTHTRAIVVGAVLFLGICGFGLTKVTSNFKIDSNLPKSGKVTDDFYFFEEHYGGFRPMEFAVMSQENYSANDFVVMSELNKLETHLRSIPQVGTIISPASIHKSISRMNNGNKESAYLFPKTESEFNKNKKILSKFKELGSNVLISKDGKNARISTRIQDIGSNRIQDLGAELDVWIGKNIDASIVEIKRTGTGLIVDKNSQYVREDLLYGLGLALLIVSLMMGFLFQNIRMLFISLIPNLMPLIFAGALLGYLGIELETGISIVFAIVFGIAVDDTIHFLSKFRLAQRAGHSDEEALKITFLETGKAICLTTVILFFGFLIMLFSNNPPSVSIGLLISITLISALVCDLFLIPILIRKFIK